MEQIEEILELVKKKMREQGGYDREAYKEFIEETIDYFIEKGKLSEEENLGLVEDTLLDMWDDVKDEMSNGN